ncbi:Hypp994 [Branchiostoma lanceolatum]|uniref:Hypp994 protein n=1 Tax=Branchiostoma lanceolatum TaxID=7740 RepID=A0A8J9ZGK6_BRALA|nr:Hypp994 [Branchiostoma lanceolatum]
MTLMTKFQLGPRIARESEYDFDDKLGDLNLNTTPLSSTPLNPQYYPPPEFQLGPRIARESEYDFDDKLEFQLGPRIARESEYDFDDKLGDLNLNTTPLSSTPLNPQYYPPPEFQLGPRIARESEYDFDDKLEFQLGPRIAREWEYDFDDKLGDLNLNT